MAEILDFGGAKEEGGTSRSSLWGAFTSRICARHGEVRQDFSLCSSDEFLQKCFQQTEKCAIMQNGLPYEYRAKMRRRSRKVPRHEKMPRKQGVRREA